MLKSENNIEKKKDRSPREISNRRDIEKYLFESACVGEIVVL
jgi:hypothetical protein